MTTAPAARVALALLIAMVMLGACTQATTQQPVVIQPTEISLPPTDGTPASEQASTPSAVPGSPRPTTPIPASAATPPPDSEPSTSEPPPQPTAEQQTPVTVPSTSAVDLARDLGVDGLVGLLDDLIESDEDWQQVIGRRGRDLRDELDGLGQRPKRKDIDRAVNRLDEWLDDGQIDVEFGQAVRVVLGELPAREDGNNGGGNDDDDD